MTDARLVTGASSGIGAALARHLASPGRTLLLWGRDPGRLGTVAAECRARGATVRTRILDLADTEAAIRAILAEDDDLPIGRAYLNAGRGDMKPPDRIVEDPRTVAALGLVNFVAPAALATALAERMAGRGGGTIVLVGSVAAFHALPMAAGYAASKAGLAHFADALSIGLAPYGVDVLLVSPGFVDTPMSRRLRCPKPFLVTPERAASRIVRAAGRRRRHLVLPWPFAVLRTVDRFSPSPIRRRILARLRVSEHGAPGGAPDGAQGATSSSTTSSSDSSVAAAADGDRDAGRTRP